MKNPNKVPYIETDMRAKNRKSNRVDNPMPDLMETRMINRKLN